MADKLSKFNIKGTLADVIDAEARALIAELSEDVSGMASDVSSAVSTAEDAKTTAEAAQRTADEKLSPADAWKCGQLSKTFNNITIANNSTYDFIFDIPDGATGALPVYIRSADATRPLIPINMFAYGSQIHAHMLNLGTSLSNATIMIQMTYMYK